MSAPLWTARDAARATGGEARGDWAASGVSIDSRTTAEGDLFVALRGPRQDGHAFVAAALAAGAAAAMVDHEPPGLAADAPLLRVRDTQDGLAALGRAGRARSAARVVAVTGSVGKTGTKEALRHLLDRQGGCHASVASHNNHWGVPLTLARLPPAVPWAVVEIGMNHAGEIRALVPMVRPRVAVITAIAPAHIGNFADGIDGIARAKAEILEGLEPGGTAVLPADSPQLPILLEAARRAEVGTILTFGAAASADWRLLEARLAPERSEVEALCRGRRLRFAIGAAGRHWAANALAVLAAVEALGGDVERAAADLSDFAPPSGRGRQRRLPVPGGSVLLLDESYNANPASMEAAIALLGLQPGRRLAVLGDMLELGEGGPAMHAALAAPLEAAGVARVFTCGPLMAHLAARLPAALRGAHAPDSAALAPLVVEALRPGDVVLVKGSLGSRMARIVEALERAGAG
ncbi:MAG: UDP-N-acetylmuramoyl-tripeptide--D-alanyl-D-alanine ligase [Geminicoccaceae bacterium]|nr:UDP-N-acetylmuramoyl-tripeptide--D-alanyl-D-alanine ligase [Geminicoccaceae bacterium]MCX8102471.1 UDP-N-acetylmuramoyl-tripeptide--D-alanyl-D-alanine ligase [Geminicoccaceae bacterium]